MCYLCGRVPDKLSIDHVVPKRCIKPSERGKFYSVPGRLKQCCRDCNRMKADMSLEELIERARKIVEFQYTQLLQEAA